MSEENFKIKNLVNDLPSSNLSNNVYNYSPLNNYE